MSIIREKRNHSNITRYYQVQHVSNTEEATRWICLIVGLDEFETNYLYLSDLVNRWDEGSGDLQIDPPISEDAVLQEVVSRNADLISVNGKYKGKPIILGVDLKNYSVFVTLRKKEAADIESIERQLELNGWQQPSNTN